MAIPQEKTYTLEDLYALPDGERAELIDGRLYNMAPPNRMHQKISGKLHQTIANYISAKNTSPSNPETDYGIKLYKYRTAGVREYWIVNPVKHAVIVYDFEHEKCTNLYSFEDTIPVCIYPDLSICIADLLNK